MHKYEYLIFRSHFDWLILGLHRSLHIMNILLNSPPKDIIQIVFYGNGALRVVKVPLLLPRLSQHCVRWIRGVKARHFSTRQVSCLLFS